MNIKMKITDRERWVLALVPTILILGIYGLQMEPSLSDSLDKEQIRVNEASTPTTPAGPSAALVKAKADLADKTRHIAEQTAARDKLQRELNALSQQVAAARNNRHAAAAIEQIQAIFARNGITPARSEPASAANSQHAPSELISVLAPTDSAGGGSPDGPRVWHLVIDGDLPHFQRALVQLTQEAPTVVPLSMNLVYNPDDDGQTRLLELWLLY